MAKFSKNLSRLSNLLKLCINKFVLKEEEKEKEAKKVTNLDMVTEFLVNFRNNSDKLMWRNLIKNADMSSRK
jgi:hypothetical protein